VYLIELGVMRRLLLLCLLSLACLIPKGGMAGTEMFSPQEQQWIANNPTVTYAFIVSWPLDYHEEGHHIGLSREYLDEISKLTGLKFTLSDRYSKPAQLFSAIAPELLSAQKLQDWRFTERWISTNALIVSHKRGHNIQSLDQLSGKRVAIRSGTLYESWLQENRPDIMLLPKSHTREVFDAVAQGEADVGLGADLVMRPLLQRYFSHQLTIAGQIPELMTGIRMGVSASEPELLSIINKALAAIPANQASAIFNRWTGEMKLGYPSAGVIFSLYQWEILAFSLLIIMLGWLLHRAVLLRRRAIASEARKTQFLAMMSHEIRTPMNAMIASLELMKQPENQQQQGQFLALACSSARSLLDLLNDILDHSKLSAQRIALECQPFAMAELLNAVCDSYRPMAAEKGLTLQVSIADGLQQQWTLGDPHRLRQISNNLLSNAIKFTEKGTISITLDAEFYPDSTCMMSLAVADTGIGIAAESQPTLFEAWTQVDSAADRRYSGSGLGLWICHQLVMLMRGVLLCVSQPGEGTTFTLRVPLRLCAAQNAPAERSLPRFSADTAILLVEDNPAAQHTMQAQLVALGCQVELAENGEQALQLLHEENYYDVILLDINLPDISGYDIARQFRVLEQERGSEPMPMVAISAMSDDAHYEQCHNSGLDAVLSKPI
jgi:Signal transduction histidine kinase